MTRVNPSELSNIVAIASGGDFGLALDNRGQVLSWGENHYGAADVPAGLRDVRAIAASSTNGLALNGDGTVTAWGSNRNGQAVVPDGLRDVIAIDTGGETSFALRNDGTAVYWGGFASGGVKTMYAPGFAIVSIGVGDAYIGAVFNDGEMGGDYMPLSDGYKPVPTPRPLPFLTSVSMGSGFVVALTSERKVIAWGRNDYGQSSPPTSLADVVAISAGGGSSLALRSDGTVVGWGSSTPPSDLKGVKAVAAGSTSIALLIDGSLRTWNNED